MAEAAPACPPPHPAPAGPTRYRMPEGAVDCHAHVIGADSLVAGRSYTPPPAPLAAYLAMLDATAMHHGVLIQVSVHGRDNSLLLAALAANPRRLRGVAVIEPDRPERELQALKQAGIAGLRLNVLFGGGIGFAELERYDALCRDWGWHLQFLLDARQLPELAPRLGRLTVPFVIDHMGHFPTAAGLDCPGFQCLLALLRDGGWVKLQGAFRTSSQGFPYGDTIPFARALNDAAPERCLWGSDWPHVAHWGRMPSLSELLDLIADWVPDERRRHQLFVDNPRRLYGFAN